MAHKRDYKPEDIAFPNQVITESELVNEMQKSYIDYAMSVIVGRALPDVRDGLIVKNNDSILPWLQKLGLHE